MSQVGACLATLNEHGVAGPAQVLRAIPFFVTNWTLVLILAHRWTHAHVDLLLLSWVVLAASTFLIFVRPGYFQLPVAWSSTGGVCKLETGAVALLIHAAIHVLPFAFVAGRYGEYYLARGFGAPQILAAFLIVLYVHSVRFEEVYDLPYETAGLVGLAAMACYAAALAAHP